MSVKTTKNALQISRRNLLGGVAAAAAGVVSLRLFSYPAYAAGELNILAWEGYDLNTELADWRKANGVTAQSSSMTSQDDVHTPFLAGNPPGIDLAEYNHAYSDLYIRELKIVRPIDRSKVPNYNSENLFDAFYDKPTWFSEGKLWGAPYIWGMNSIVYNPKRMKKPTAYTDLLTPELKGRIAIWDEPNVMWPIAARVSGLGEKYPKLSRDEVQTAFSELGKYREQARLIAINMGELINFLVSGEIDAVVCADPAIIVQAQQQGVELEIAYPKEGAVLWVDAWFLPISCDNVETAQAYINQALDPQIQAKVAMAINQAPVSRKATEYLDDKSRARFNFGEIDTLLAAGLPGIPPATGDNQTASYGDWLQAWQSFKAGN
ncbi:ABC transporter substrate-binding protein (plasmid) [Agrobacterium sp. rho-13.3]|uniref:ABC transporter substrate-binding protein n=1 Tax=Agrobacterium sp. rho-13.3 TaxID=3072980 RepID=UPI002A0CD8DE|nr:extracellular solute-binding protein [Agrobacterium sp. rho-13.3]MDX8310283.1 extracellular solute-binding protein [Agrobacterium sp. rho-13.3]